MIKFTKLCPYQYFGIKLKNNSNIFLIPYSRKDMADFLGVDRSALSRELSRLKDDGLIDYEKNIFKLL